jgi:cell division protein YceG involved in septum cleavage
MKQKDILIIIVLLFIFVLVWMGGSIYHSTVSSTISETTSKDIFPIEPSFDTKAIDKLKERQKIIPSFELGNVTPTPIALPTLKIFPQNASEGGKLLL